MISLNLIWISLKKTAGISGDDKNTFSGKRSNPYPTGPMKKTPMLTQFEKAAKLKANTLYGAIRQLIRGL